jgi:hypothetical protein
VAGVPRRGKILFAAQMFSPDGFVRPSAAMAYLAPPLSRAGYEVVVSRAKTFSRFPYARDRHELARHTTQLLSDVTAERPDFVAFPVLDANAGNVYAMSQSLLQQAPDLAQVFGATFVTVNPGFSAKWLAGLPNSILVNGEAALVLPEALESFRLNAANSLPGVLVRRDGRVLGGDFLRRVSLTSAEFESIEPTFAFQDEVLENLGGFDLTTGLGCFEECGFCAASGRFRSVHVSLSSDAWLRQVGRAVAEARTQKPGLKIVVGIHDDSFFYDPRRGLDHLRRFRESYGHEEVELRLQISFASLFGPRGEFMEEIPQSLLRPDGTPLVQTVFVGGDYWESGERARNKGRRGGQITNRQIRQAVEAFAQRKIPLHSFWMMGDERTSVTSFALGTLFLAELILDFGPYFSVSLPDHLELYTGTPMRERVLADATYPRSKLVPLDRLTAGDEEIVIYRPVSPPGQMLDYIWLQLAKMQASVPQDYQTVLLMQPHKWLNFIHAIAGKWRDEVLSGRQHALLLKYIGAVDGEEARETLLAKGEFAGIKDFPRSFMFLGERVQFNLKELLAAAEMDFALPDYYKKRALYEAERRRRNPNFS